MRGTVFETFYHYEYVPVNYSEEDRSFSYETILVTISRKKDTFDALMDQLDLTPENGAAYDAEDNTWYINKENTAVSIKFSDDRIVSSAEELSEYFVFEKRSIS